MTSNVNKTTYQYTSLMIGSESNKTGGANSYPTADPPTITTNASLTLNVYRLGGNTPNFRSARRTFRLLPTAFEYKKTTEMGQMGYRNSRSQSDRNTYGWISEYQAGCFGPSNISTFRTMSDTEKADLRAISGNALLEKVKSQTVNVAQAMGERKQTARLIGDTAIRIASCIRSLRKGDIASAARAIGVDAPKRAASRYKRDFPVRPGKAASRAWLELQYGWKPLLGDVFGACEQLAQNENRVMYDTKRAKARKVVDLSKKTVFVDGKVITTTVVSGNLSMSYVQSATYAKGDSTRRTLAQLGISNPLLVAWELMPWSFVVDWFLPVGQFIGSLDATNGVVFYSGYESYFVKSYAIQTVTIQGIDNSGVKIDSMKISSNEIIHTKRAPLLGFPEPSMPRFKNPLSLAHAANAIALLTQLFRK